MSSARSTGTVRATASCCASCQDGGRPTLLGRAIAEFGRAAKTLHQLSCVDSDAYRRCIGVHFNRHEGGHSVARVIFHGNRGELRQPFPQGRHAPPTAVRHYARCDVGSRIVACSRSYAGF
jgi:TnpA family transposase